MSAWEVMSEIARTILIMSAAGSVLTLLLFALKPLIKNRMPKSMQYYLWVLTLVALLVPFSTFISIPVSTPMTPVQEMIEANVKTTIEMQEELAWERHNIPYEKLGAPEQIDITFKEIGLMNGAFNNYLLFSLITLGAVKFLIEITQYFIFGIKLRRRRFLAQGNEIALLHEICADRTPPRIYRNSLVPTPMLIGIYRPAIYLPDVEYSEVQLRNILLHELTHLRRHDVIVKWLAAIAVHVHWFNPVIYLMRRELGRACELACDEAVIRSLDTDGKQNYGDTLIAVVSEHKTPKAVLSTTMCEEKKALKERLGAIMKHKKFSKKAIVLSCALLAIVVCGTVLLGAASGAGNSVNNATPNNMARDNDNAYIPKTADENPVVTLYSFDESNNNGSENDVARHFVSKLIPEPETGWTRLSETIFIDVAIPEGTIAVQTYYAEAGTEATTYRMMDSKYSAPYVIPTTDGENANPRGNTWNAADYFPDGFLGHIWAVTIDANGAEHMSDIIKVLYEPETVPSSDIEEIAEKNYVGGAYLWPVPDNYTISATFGTRIHPVEKATVTHDGIDISAPSGTPILAANAGTIIEMGENTTDGYFIKLKHSGGHQTFYAHMYGFVEGLAKYDTVKKGDVIGYVGNTGESTGNHLHFGLNIDGEYVNPIDYLPITE